MSTSPWPSRGARTTAHPDDVAAYYDRWTERYRSAFGDAIQAHRPTDDVELYEYLLRRSGLRDGRRALDAGCGVCGPSRYFASRLDLTIEALTVSPEQASIAARLIDAEGLSDRIRVRQGDYHRLAEIYPRESFDVVFFLEALSHAHRPLDVLTGVYEVLVPGGIVYVKDYFIRESPDPDEQRRILRVVERVDRYFATNTAWLGDIERCLEQAGFLRLMVEAPLFSVDNSRWQQFERDNGIDLFEGADSFDWSQWAELKFQKP